MTVGIGLPPYRYVILLKLASLANIYLMRMAGFTSRSSGLIHVSSNQQIRCKEKWLTDTGEFRGQEAVHMFLMCAEINQIDSLH